MDYEQLIGGMTDEDMKQMMIRLLSHMRLDDQVDIIEEHMDEHVSDELFTRWSNAADVPDDEDEDEDGDEETEVEDEDEDEDDGEVEKETA